MTRSTAHGGNRHPAAAWHHENAGIATAIQGLVQSVDALTDAMERRWGVGRLRLLVPDDLRERFDRQWRK